MVGGRPAHTMAESRGRSWVPLARRKKGRDTGRDAGKMNREGRDRRRVKEQMQEIGGEYWWINQEDKAMGTCILETVGGIQRTKVATARERERGREDEGAERENIEKDWVRVCVRAGQSKPCSSQS